VRCNDEVEAQSRSERDRWTFYGTIKMILQKIGETLASSSGSGMFFGDRQFALTPA
jgi:hypothetical protein